MADTNIITQIKEAEKKADKKIEQARIEAEQNINNAKNEKEKALNGLETALNGKIQKLNEETEKNIAGAKAMHKQKIEHKLQELDSISDSKLDKAVDFIFNKIV